MKKILIITAIVIAILVGFRFVSVKISESNRAKQLAASSIPSVQLASVETKEITTSIEIPGRVQSMDKVDLIARIDGYLQKKHFKEGDFVKKGQVLLTIEPTQYLNNLNTAKAELELKKIMIEVQNLLVKISSQNPLMMAYMLINYQQKRLLKQQMQH